MTTAEAEAEAKAKTEVTEAESDIENSYRVVRVEEKAITDVEVVIDKSGEQGPRKGQSN